MRSCATALAARVWSRSATSVLTAAADASAAWRCCASAAVADAAAASTRIASAPSAPSDASSSTRSAVSSASLCAHMSAS
eukprot:7358241-Prymnesium_polylepis.1